MRRIIELNYYAPLLLACSICIGLFAQAARADQSKIIWSCKKPYTQENILWLVEWGEKSYIKVFDQRIPAVYSISGLTKRWDWELDEDLTYKYSIVLRPDKVAFYFDFTISKDGTAKAKETYICKK